LARKSSVQWKGWGNHERNEAKDENRRRDRAHPVCLDCPRWRREKTALLIANAKYANFGSLATPVKEARELRDTLKSIGFQVTLVENGSRESMMEAIADFEDSLKKRGGVAFFHYGGHGLQVAGKNYLIPSDAEIPDERRVETRAVSVDEIMSALDAARTGTNIVVLDACRNNPLPAQSGRSASRGLSTVSFKPKN